MHVKKKLIIFTGARSDYGLQKNIIKELKKNKNVYLKILAGPDHFEKSFGTTYKEIIKDNLVIDYKIRNINKKIKFNKKISNLFSNFNTINEKNNFDYAILLGDRYETFLFAVSCYFNKIPIIHLYGGETTYGAIDESLRHSITKLSFYHFVSNEIHRKRVIQLGESPKNVFNFGYTGVENFLTIKPQKKENIFKKYKIYTKKKIVLVTFHPETISKISYKDQIKTLIQAIRNINSAYFIFNINNSDPGSEFFLKMINNLNLKYNNIKTIKSLGVNDYISFVNLSTLVIGNSSSGIIEVPYAGKPSINIGDRQQGRISKKTVVNVKLNSKEITYQINKFLKKKINKNKKYKLVRSSKLISKKIISLINANKIAFKKKIFYDI